jgi:hypothetical protein
VHHSRPDLIERIATMVLAHPGVDQVIWRERLTGDGSGYVVATNRGQLTFRRATSPGGMVDEFGGRWSWSGEPATLTIEPDNGSFTFRDYPNAFERIAGVLDLDLSGDIWVTAKPGCEFEVPGGRAHVGGASHGALHALDSHSPVIVAGGGSPWRLPAAMRSVDIAPLCTHILEMSMRYRVGDPRG